MQNMFLKQKLPASLYLLRHIGAEKIDVKGLGKLCKSLLRVRISYIRKQEERKYGIEYALLGKVIGLSSERQDDSCPELC